MFFLNRDLMLHPHRVRGSMRYWLLFLEREKNKRTEYNCPQHPALRNQLPQENSRTLGRWHKGESGFQSTAGPTALTTLPDGLQDSSPILGDAGFWDMPAAPSSGEPRKHIALLWAVEKGGRAMQIRKEENSVLCGFSQIIWQRFPPWNTGLAEKLQNGI